MRQDLIRLTCKMSIEIQLSNVTFFRYKCPNIWKKLSLVSKEELGMNKLEVLQMSPVFCMF